MTRVRRAIARIKDSRGYRAWTRYGDVSGNVLAGGIAYMAFFSIIPALILGLSAFGLVLRNQPDVFDSVVSAVSGALPGVIKDAANPGGLIDASSPPAPNALTVTGAISLVTLLLAGLGWLSALRSGVRVVFGRPRLADNVVRGKVRDLAVMVVLGLAFLVSGVLSTGVSAAAAWLLTEAGIGADSTVGQLSLRFLTIVVVLVVDVFLMLVVFRLLSGLRLPWEDLLQGALVGAVGLGVLKLLSGLLLAGAAKKPVLGAFAVIIGMLVLLNLMGRVMLLAAAWAATTADERGRLAGAPEGAVPTGPPTALGPRDPLLPTFGQRSGDRATLAAGAILGLAAMAGLRTARRGASAALATLRGRPD